MNKFQESLDRIKKNLPLHEDSWIDEDREHILTIMEALEKQIPKKPIDKTLEYDGYYGRCPDCNRVIYDYKDRNRCYNCGQSLDWSDKE